jgi:hypothetical protein
MAFEADLVTVLKTSGTTRVYLGFAPVNTTRPYITVQQVGGESINQLSNAAPGLRSAEVQVNVWAGNYVDAITVARAAEAAMRASATFTAKPIGEPVSDFDADVPVHGTRQEFRCWHRS